MTIRNEVRRIAARAQVVGTELEDRGQRVLDVLQGWEAGPTRAAAATPEEVCACGHGAAEHGDDGKGLCMYQAPRWETMQPAQSCWCASFTAAAKGTAGTDRREEQKQAARAAEQYAEHVADLRLLDEVLDRIERRNDMAIPPDMEQLRNRRTGEFDPETATDALAAGFCPHCWACGVRQVPISPPEGKGQVRRYADRCRPCGDFRKDEGIDKPKEMVQGHAQIPPKRYGPEDYERMVNAARAAAAPAKGKKGKRGKKAKAA